MEKVFRRNGYQYDLTFLGQRYLDYARRVLALDQDWKKELSDMRSYYNGELNIALPPMRSTSLIHSCCLLLTKNTQVSALIFRIWPFDIGQADIRYQSGFCHFKQLAGASQTKL